MTLKLNPLWLCLILISVSQIALADRSMMRRNLTFVVRSSDRVKHIAHRFHTTAKSITKLNHPMRKGQLLSAGRKVTIPVWVQKKVVLAGQESKEFNMADYELNRDSVEGDVNDDFVSMASIEADTNRRIVIDKEINKLDKKIGKLNQRIDSLQNSPDNINADGGADNRENQLVLRKMQIAKERAKGKQGIGMEIDSLVQAKAKLNQEKYKINSRVAEYEMLVENASYNSKHNVTETNLIVLNEWGDDPQKAINPSLIKKR